MTGGFRPFDTPAMYGGDWRAWFRFGVSFALLNVAALLYFVVFNSLTGLTVFRVTFWPTLGLLVLSLAGFGFYRICFGVMLLRWDQSYLFYGSESELPPRLAEELRQRSKRHKEALPHVAPGLLWVFVCTALGWCLTKFGA